jgi:hypothetical protein
MPRKSLRQQRFIHRHAKARPKCRGVRARLSRMAAEWLQNAVKWFEAAYPGRTISLKEAERA